jgi:hypothetical protein
MGRSVVALVPAESSEMDLKLSEETEFEEPFSFHQRRTGILELRENGALVLAYRFGLQTPLKVPPDRYRSTYIHPVMDPFGTPLTDDFPEDHLHHRGLSWMWPHVTVENQVHDLWHIRGVRQRFSKWLLKETGPLCATVGIKNTWEVMDRSVVDEWVWVRAFVAGKLGRTVDLSLTWAAKRRISIRGQDEKGYGGLCFRLAPRDEPIITTPSGRLPVDSDLQPYPWVDQSGRFGDRTAVSGVAIFQHPENLDFPAGWCLRHYGFLGVSWPGIESFVLEPGRSITLRFRIWLHRNDARGGAVSRAYIGYSDPPSVSLRTLPE